MPRHFQCKRFRAKLRIVYVPGHDPLPKLPPEFQHRRKSHPRNLRRNRWRPPISRRNAKRRRFAPLRDTALGKIYSSKAEELCGARQLRELSGGLAPAMLKSAREARSHEQCPLVFCGPGAESPKPRTDVAIPEERYARRFLNPSLAGP